MEVEGPRSGVCMGSTDRNGLAVSLSWDTGLDAPATLLSYLQKAKWVVFSPWGLGAEGEHSYLVWGVQTGPNSCSPMGLFLKRYKFLGFHETKNTSHGNELV